MQPQLDLLRRAHDAHIQPKACFCRGGPCHCWWNQWKLQLKKLQEKGMRQALLDAVLLQSFDDRDGLQATLRERKMDWK